MPPRESLEFSVIPNCVSMVPQYWTIDLAAPYQFWQLWRKWYPSWPGFLSLFLYAHHVLLQLTGNCGVFALCCVLCWTEFMSLIIMLYHLAPQHLVLYIWSVTAGCAMNVCVCSPDTCSNSPLLTVTTQRWGQQSVMELWWSHTPSSAGITHTSTITTSGVLCPQKECSTYIPSSESSYHLLHPQTPNAGERLPNSLLVNVLICVHIHLLKIWF